MAALTKLTTNINLEMSGDTKRYLVSAKQGDKATRFIIARLLNNGEPYTIPTGARAVINITKHMFTFRFGCDSRIDKSSTCSLRNGVLRH